MSAKTFLFILLLGSAAAGGWFSGRQAGSISGNSVSKEHQVLFYQSPMHPWIKSDKPGNCTICGMKLVPVYEGDQPIETAADAHVRLSASSVSVLNVETADAKVRPLQRTLRVAGTIDDDDTRHRRLSAYVDGRIEQLGVRYVSADVREGQLLAKLYSPKLLTARDEYILVMRQPASPQRDRLLAAARERLVRLGCPRADCKAPKSSRSAELSGDSRSARRNRGVAQCLRRTVREGRRGSFRDR